MKHLIVILTCFLPYFSIAQFTLTDSLIAYYPFNGNSIDESNNGNNGTVFGATLTTDRLGNPNSAYSFDGINDEIIVTTPFGGQAVINNEFTMTGWLKTTTSKTNAVVISIHTACQGGASNDYFIAHISNLNNGTASFSDFITQLYYHSPFTMTDESAISDDNWHFFAYTYDNGSTVLRIDNNIVASDNVIPSNYNHSPSVNLVIGNVHSTSCPFDSYFEGDLDELRLYTRVLSNSELGILYNETQIVANFNVINNNCDTEVSFSNSSANADTYFWDFGDGNASNQENPTHNYTTEGTYTVTLTASNNNGSSNIIVRDVVINQPPLADFIRSSIAKINSAILFTDNSSSDVITWAWDFGNSFSSTLQNPNISYTLAGVYNVQLIVTDDLGCTDTITKSVTISEDEKDFFINLPNAFTPNNDSRNDRFEILSASNFYQILDFKVYNRWGNLVYDTPSQEGWDGLINGEKAPADTYIYVLNIRLQDGTTQQFKGELLLIP
jgi:gliding motility-associated-like protein